MKRRGYSLIEAIMASFLLVFTFFLVSRLFHTGLQLSTKVESRMTSVRLAEKRLAAIRLWAKSSKDWTGPPVSPTDPEFPGYTVEVSLQDEILFSPSKSLELAFPGGNRRAMPTATKKAVVTVKKPGLPDFRLAGVITKGDWDWGSDADIRVSPSTATITGPNQEVEFEVQAFDVDGDEDQDVFFHWEIEPNFTTSNPSTAEVRLKTRDGRRAVVRNRVRRRPGVWVPQNGSCQLVAYARYKGHYRRGVSGVITLVAP